MFLKSGTLLQGSKYKIVRVLGQGGFGITYEAEHALLGGRFAVKEFFMKDICERDETSLTMSVPSTGSRDLVEKFKRKFIKEAQLVFEMSHPNVIRVLDVFEENGTAYFVMEHMPGGSLKEKVENEGPLSEADAEKYILQIARALAYIHGRNTVHLDVKPANILLNAKGEAVLIDFGVSKHYDKEGQQTSSTPVGISRGYAPLEQSRSGDVSQFTPATDIYALGATLYTLVTGEIPPEATVVNEDGLARPKGVSDRIWTVIEQSMAPRRKDRPQRIEDFLKLLGVPEDESPSEETEIPAEGPESPEPKRTSRRSKFLWGLLLGVLFGVFLAAGAVWLIPMNSEPVEGSPMPPAYPTDSLFSVNLSLEQTIADLQKQVEAENSKADDHQQQLDAEKSRSEDLQQQLDAEKSRSEDLQQKVNAEKQRADDAQKQADAQKRRADNLQQQLDAEKSRADNLEQQVNAKAKEAQKTKNAAKFNYTESAFDINMKMVFVQGGEFVMGGTSEQGGDADSDEGVIRRVTVGDFFIGQFEVTQSQWKSVIGTSITDQRNRANPLGSFFGKGHDYPMYYVSWEEASEFCRVLSRKTGKKYSLPTEAEWEYVARGGQKSDTTKYAGGNMVERVAWYYSNSSSSTQPVGKKAPNELDLYDMSGNVYEWCSDWYDST